MDNAILLRLLGAGLVIVASVLVFRPEVIEKVLVRRDDDPRAHKHHAEILQGLRMAGIASAVVAVLFLAMSSRIG